LIDDLTLIFGILAGVSECIIVFILPSVFYYIADRKVRAKEGWIGKEGKVKRGEMVAVAFFFSLGLCYFTVSNYFNIMKLKKF
jgi:cytochrome c biogenesis protein CcdA